MFALRKHYNITIANGAESVLGVRYEGVKVLIANTEESIATQFDDVYTINKKLELLIPNLEKDLSKHTFTVFETVNKDKLVLSNKWIHAYSLVDFTDITVKVLGKTTGEAITSVDESTVREALESIGYRIEFLT